MRSIAPHMRSIGVPRLFRKHDNIIFQGEVPRSVTVILDGIVKAYTITTNGEERIMALYGKGDLLPLAWAVGEAPNALFYYEAINDVRSVQVPKKDFTDMIERDPEFRSALLALIGKEYTALLLRVTGLVQSRAIDKICYTLYYLMFRHGIERGDSTYLIDVKLSQASLADLIGQTRESTAKNLKILRERGVVSYNSSVYTVDKKKLEHFLGEDGFLNDAFASQNIPTYKKLPE